MIERLTDIHIQVLLIPKIEVTTWWTNRPFRSKTIIELYHVHDTSKQFHSKLKSDLDMERLPPGKLCAMSAFNLLRTFEQELLPKAMLANQSIALADKKHTAKHHLLHHPSGRHAVQTDVTLRKRLSMVRGDPRHSPRLHVGMIGYSKSRATRLSGGIVAS